MGGACGTGKLPAVDSLFARRASVGLMVRAPKPPTCNVDCRLFPDDDGVCVLCTEVRAGEVGLGVVDAPLTGVAEVGCRWLAGGFRGGGCRDFVRGLRGIARRAKSGPDPDVWPPVSRLFVLLNDAVRDIDPVVGCASRAALLSSSPWVSSPGPRDLRGGRAAVLVAGGTGLDVMELWRLPRPASGAGGGGIDDTSGAVWVVVRRALLTRRAREELRATFDRSWPLPRPTPLSIVDALKGFPSGRPLLGEFNPALAAVAVGKLPRSGSCVVRLS